MAFISSLVIKSDLLFRLIKLNNKLKRFKLVAEEGFPRKISTISKYDDKCVSGGDEQGNSFNM